MEKYMTTEIIENCRLGRRTLFHAGFAMLLLILQLVCCAAGTCYEEGPAEGIGLQAAGCSGSVHNRHGEVGCRSNGEVRRAAVSFERGVPGDAWLPVAAVWPGTIGRFDSFREFPPVRVFCPDRSNLFRLNRIIRC